MTNIDFEAENGCLRRENAAIREEITALTQKCEGLAAHIECLSSTVRALERDNAIMRGQLDMVNLIFGGDR